MASSLRWIVVASILLGSLVLASETADVNITIPVPKGTVFSVSTDELCLPASWTDIVTFFSANYVAHAATVRAKAGADTISKLILAFTCLIFPALGLAQAISSILSFASFESTELRKATRAGALVMVQRNFRWQPRPGDTIHHGALWRVDRSKSSDLESISSKLPLLYLRKLLGAEPWANFELRMPDLVSSGDSEFAFELKLPDGYSFSRVPRNALVEKKDDNFEYMEVKSSYNAAKIILAILQLIFAATSLYHARARQLSRYGYAAFGLTVAPYAVMSLLNLFGSLFCPDYDELYLVRSQILDEALRRLDESPKRLHVVGDLAELEHQLSQFHSIDDMKSKGPEIISGAVEFFSDPNGGLLASVTEPESSRDGETGERAATNATQKWRVMEEDLDSKAILGFDRLRFPCTNPFGQTEHSLRAFSRWVLRSPATPLLEPQPGWDQNGGTYTLRDMIALFIAFLVYGAIIGIVGGISRFHSGQSSELQRVWTMGWLGAGLSIVIIREAISYLSERTIAAHIAGFLRIFSWSFVLLISSFAFGGFVVVGEMLRSYGTCIPLS